MVDRTAQTVAMIQSKVREWIITGRYAPGEPLSQVTVAAELGVSRTPVREAFRLLELAGFVVAEHNKRFQVANFTAADMEDLYVLRIAVESTAIRASVPLMSDGDIEVLRASLDAMDAAIDLGSYAAWRDPHEAFHEQLLIHAGSRSRHCARDLSTHAERYRYALTLPASPTAWGDSHRDHHNLFAAAVKRVGDEASRQIVTHYGRVALSYLSLYAPLHDPRVLRTTMESLGSETQQADLQTASVDERNLSRA